jgi:hypothetical protein
MTRADDIAQQARSVFFFAKISIKAPDRVKANWGRRMKYLTAPPKDWEEGSSQIIANISGKLSSASLTSGIGLFYRRIEPAGAAFERRLCGNEDVDEDVDADEESDKYQTRRKHKIAANEEDYYALLGVHQRYPPSSTSSTNWGGGLRALPTSKKLTGVLSCNITLTKAVMKLLLKRCGCAHLTAGQQGVAGAERRAAATGVRLSGRRPLRPAA